VPARFFSCIWLVVLSLSWSTWAVAAAAPEAGVAQELTKAKAMLAELRTYVKLDDMASAIDALSSAQAALEATPKDSPDYPKKLADLKKAIDSSKEVLNTNLKRTLNLADDKRATDLLNRLEI